MPAMTQSQLSNAIAPCLLELRAPFENNAMRRHVHVAGSAVICVSYVHRGLLHYRSVGSSWIPAGTQQRDCSWQLVRRIARATPDKHGL